MTAVGGSSTIILVHVDEIALKGANRRWFTERLARNIREAVASRAGTTVATVGGHIEVACEDDASVEALVARIAHVPGAARIAPAIAVPREPEALAEAVLRHLPPEAPASFRVRVARADKRYPLTSPELERVVGARIHERVGWPVSLTRAALTVAIDVGATSARCSVASVSGRGGLPVGTGGKVVCLLSGGVDSAVAAWRVMRRGCRVEAVHLHSEPITSDASQRATRDLVTWLARGQARMRLTCLGIADLQKHIALVAPPPLRTVLYRRAMVRIAARVARRSGAIALVTGEALGQVASQTLENLASIQAVTTLPILRPLIAYDKREVVDEARRIHVPDVTVADEDDCCRVFAPTAAAIRSTPEACAALERELPLETLFDTAFQQADRVMIEADWRE